MASTRPGNAIIIALTCAVAFASASAQARRLEPDDFIVAGVPDNSFPDLDVEPDTIAIRQILGPPTVVRRHEFTPGDSITTWEYDGLEVAFGSISRIGITLTSPRVATHRGLRVGDSADRAAALYGAPACEQEGEWTFEDPRERLHVIAVTISAGRVARIFIGSLWD